ncbi:MAG: S9 family peptidase [Acidimicrobiales bacterium]|nr:MAG: S9 family peptidase [Acidimicrobiales bacterium]
MTMWKSPITPDVLVSGAVGISEVCADGSDVYWLESRPSEGGRSAVVRWRDGAIEEVTSPAANVRTRVHEYGGGAWWVENGRLVYSDDARGGELFLLDVEAGDEQQLTSEGHRYADGRFSPDGQWFLCVREVHDQANSSVINDLVAVHTDGSRVKPLTGGHDFVSSPCFGRGGEIAFVAWDHPNMPWDTTILHVGSFDGVNEGGVDASIQEVPSTGESIVLPGFTNNGRLLAVSDRSNWWNLVEVDRGTGEQTPVVAGEFEVATPGWVFGLSRWVETPDGVVAVAGFPAGDEIHFPNGFIERQHGEVSSLRAMADGRVAYAAASFTEESAVWVHDGETARRISQPRELPFGPEWISTPSPITFEVSAIDESTPSGTVAHALFFPPSNPDVTDDRLPPLMVLVHGGPTAAARRMLRLATQFWTSRGVAVCDVDYRGSTMYGREYRDALRGGWGATDVVDCVAAAHHLAVTGHVDRERLFIAGGSSGGLTVLNALSFFDVFSGGISRYGVADLAALAADTHKFEERYPEGLIGRWPEDKAIYDKRSPVNYPEKITAPLLVLQGTEDKIVPPSQSKAIVAALNAHDVPVTYIEFAGEGHGFRNADSIIAMLEAELAFVSSV